MPTKAMSIGAAASSAPTWAIDGLRIGVDFEEVGLRDASLCDEALAEKHAKAGGVSGGQADVLVEVKHFDVRPVDVAASGEGCEELELRGTGCGDDAGMSAIGQGMLERGGRVVGGGFCE